MRQKYEPTFTDVIAARMSLTGNDVASLSDRTGIPIRTMYRRLTDGNWSRDQLMLLHKVLQFSTGDLEIMLGGKIWETR